ncbi:F420-nonreducing hydrogenase (vhtG) [Archaeoglobus fulgidus DSM 4304]|uniref:F420-nonreducing hydrogenase (VhtG) n=4 Tax=Archaeoglobus fulgidus TaxID=2234 RepID=O28890_ARCFU|nr:F420-nonreducing hydrogenase (vhtG) [Archaeoglobus fulgidus DSM 4304]
MMMSLTRRNFMKLVAAMGASAFLSAYKGDIVRAVEAKKDYWHICWLNGAACTGCTVSFAQASNPDLVQILTEIIVGTSGLPIALPDYMETIHPASGTLAEKLKERWKAGEKGKRILVVEGAVQKPGYCVVAGKDFREHVREAAEVADAIVAVGQCATFGGIPAANPNPTGAMGLSEFLREEGIAKPVINLPLCPVNGEHVVIILSAVIMGAKIDLDEHGRPKALFGTNMHDELCPYRPLYDRGVFIEEPGNGDGCRFKIGCKGPVAFTDCPSRRWNGKTSYCVEAGAPCIACSEPGWPDKFSPFYAELPSIPSFLGLNPTTLGAGIFGATAVGIGVHAVRRKLRGEKDEQDSY